jgi:hypothetical protein
MTTSSSATPAAPASAGPNVVVSGDDGGHAWVGRGACCSGPPRGRRAHTGDNGLLTEPVRRVLQTGLEVEVTDHSGYEARAVEGRGSATAATAATPRR